VKRRVAAFLLAAPIALALTAAEANASEVPAERHVYVFLVDHASFEDLMSVREVAALARAGGAALMSRDPQTPYAVEAPGFGPLALNLSRFRFAVPPSGLGRQAALEAAGHEIGRVLGSAAGQDVLVVVASVSPSAAMETAGDGLYGIVVASGKAPLDRSSAPMRSLTSDSTRRAGVVIEDDILPTISGFTGNRFPTQTEGSPIRVVDAPPPFDLHERYLAQRRMSVPIGIAAGLYVTLAGLFALTLLILGRRVPRRLAHFAAWLAMSLPILGVALLAAGHLPTLSYATVVPFVVGLTLLGTVAFVPLRRFGALVPPVGMGVAVLAYFAVEAALGWTAALTPFHGASELDGGRFYGLPNAFIGLLIGASLYVAHRMNLVAGFVLIVAVALFAGLPGMGANLGGAISLFAAAGLWLAKCRFGRVGWRGAALTAVVVIAGAVVVLLAHRFLTSSPTHITRFEESPGGLSGIWRTFADRLLVGWHLIVRNPFALVPVLGLPVVLVALLRPPAPLRGSLAAHPDWRDALLVTILASIVAYVANDSGAAACGLGFALGLGGLFYVSLIEGTWKMTAT
jgi:hypothetical protein